MHHSRPPNTVQSGLQHQPRQHVLHKPCAEVLTVFPWAGLVPRLGSALISLQALLSRTFVQNTICRPPSDLVSLHNVQIEEEEEEILKRKEQSKAAKAAHK